MRQSRFNDSQIVAILKQSESGVSAADICREHGMSQALFYNWRTKFGGMNASLFDTRDLATTFVTKSHER